MPKVSLETLQKDCAWLPARTPWCWGGCCEAFEGAKGQSRNRTKRLRLTASRARLGAGTEHALGAARVAARRKRRGRLWSCCRALERAKGQSRNRTKRQCLAASTDALVLGRQSSTQALGSARVAEQRKRRYAKPFKGQSRNRAKRLRLTASRARLGAETEHALGAARVAARRKRQGRFLELLQGLWRCQRSVSKPYKKTVSGCQHGRLCAGETKLHTRLGFCKGGWA